MRRSAHLTLRRHYYLGAPELWGTCLQGDQPSRKRGRHVDEPPLTMTPARASEAPRRCLATSSETGAVNKVDRPTSIFVPFVFSTQLPLNYQPISLLSPDPPATCSARQGGGKGQAGLRKMAIAPIPAPTGDPESLDFSSIGRQQAGLLFQGLCLWWSLVGVISVSRQLAGSYLLLQILSAALEKLEDKLCRNLY